ncbi:MAG: hypothetical protein IIA82_11135 [Thaumarchaeota archaeon]|nr:hypothetical protein [Nitrososphaerota archaeon]
MKKVLLSGMIVGVFLISIVTYGIASAQENNIPVWIKNNAGWWAEEKISDQDFVQGIQWLIQSDLIVITPIENDVKESEQQIPSWIKVVAGFWAENKISDNEFLGGIQFLMKIGVIKISSDKSILDERSFREHEYSGYSPLFRTFAYEKDFVWLEDERVPSELQFEFKPELSDTYQEISILDEKQTVVVVIPIFTSSAYWEPAFYTYYRGECDISCLTTQIEYTKSLGYSASTNAVNVLKLLGYPTITDIDIDKDPNILKNYEKLILLHSEYVTKKEFDAITNHPKVVYLYPNALFAEISANYDDDTITLIRGHGYPEENIDNGFDWEFENT